jgi:hypothetical protein
MQVADAVALAVVAALLVGAGWWVARLRRQVRGLQAEVRQYEGALVWCEVDRARPTAAQQALQSAYARHRMQEDTPAAYGAVLEAGVVLRTIVGQRLVDTLEAVRVARSHE